MVLGCLWQVTFISIARRAPADLRLFNRIEQNAWGADEVSRRSLSPVSSSSADRFCLDSTTLSLKLEAS